MNRYLLENRLIRQRSEDALESDQLCKIDLSLDSVLKANEKPARLKGTDFYDVFQHSLILAHRL